MLHALLILSAFVFLTFLLAAAAVAPHDERHGVKLAIAAACAVIGARLVAYDGGASVLLDSAGALALLVWRRQAWGWIHKACRRQPIDLSRVWSPPTPTTPAQNRQIAGGLRRD